MTLRVNDYIIIRLNPSKCRSNEYMKWTVFDKYVSYVQDLIAIPAVLECVNTLSVSEPTARFIRGFLKLNLHRKSTRIAL